MLPKTESFSDHDALDYDTALLYGLGFRAKLRIALIVHHAGQVTPTDLIRWMTVPGQMPYEKALMGRHLAEMLKSRILVYRPVKAARLYYLNPQFLGDIEAVLSPFLGRDYAVADRAVWERLRRQGDLIVEKYRDLPTSQPRREA